MFGMNRTFSEWIGSFNGEAFHLAMPDCVQQFLRPEVTFFGLPLCFQHPPVGLVWSVRFARFNYKALLPDRPSRHGTARQRNHCLWLRAEREAIFF